jgi:hypothetical protein
MARALKFVQQTCLIGMVRVWTGKLYQQESATVFTALDVKQYAQNMQLG